MPNMTLAIPADLHCFLKKHSEINWSEVARRAMALQAKKIQLMESLVEKSEFSEEDVDILDKKIKEGLFKRFSK